MTPINTDLARAKRRLQHLNGARSQPSRLRESSGGDERERQTVTLAQRSFADRDRGFDFCSAWSAMIGPGLISE